MAWLYFYSLKCVWERWMKSVMGENEWKWIKESGKRVSLTFWLKWKRM